MDLNEEAVLEIIWLLSCNGPFFMIRERRVLVIIRVLVISCLLVFVLDICNLGFIFIASIAE
jgi:hypothetical protein